MKLALGTVQFGMPYGISNGTGQVSAADVEQILRAAAAAGMNVLDTAIGYGESESVLGRMDLTNWDVVSKLPGMPETAIAAAWVRSSAEQSLRRLGVGRLYAFMLHRPSDLLGPQGEAIYRAVADLKAEGLVERIGFSVYGPAELDVYFGRFPPDIVQAPLNVLDQRLITSGWLETLAGAGVEVHTRSAFLQGLLLMESASRPGKFNRWSRQFDMWDAWVAESGKGRLAAALGFPLSQVGVQRVVVGVDAPAHLHEIIEASQRPYAAQADGLAIDDEALINPSLWTRL